MSALTDRITAEHGALFNSWNTCLCGAKLATTSKWNRHIAEVTEAAVREQVAQDIRVARDEFERTGMEAVAYDDASRIAEGVNL